MKLRTVIVGNNHRPLEAQQRYHALEHEEELVLEREPENPYDSNAIAVYSTDGVHLGYIPRTQNAELAAALDADREFIATYDPDIDRVFIEEDEPTESAA